MPAARTTAAAQPAAAAATAPPADQRSRSMRHQRRRMIDDPTARPDRRRIGGECTALLSRARCATDRSPGRWPVRRPVRHSPVSDERERERFAVSTHRNICENQNDSAHHQHLVADAQSPVSGRHTVRVNGPNRRQSGRPVGRLQAEAEPTVPAAMQLQLEDLPERARHTTKPKKTRFRALVHIEIKRKQLSVLNYSHFR